MRQRSRTLLYVGLVLGGLLLAALAGLRVLSHVQTPYQWGPFRGQFVDAETATPLKEVAILVVWWEAVFSPTGHPTRKFYEAKEAVTDTEGRFVVPPISVPLWKVGVQPGQVIFFAPGYVVEKEVVTPPDGVRFVDPTVVQMRRLKSREELLTKSRGYPSQIPDAKIPTFLGAVDIEHEMLWPGITRPRRSGRP